jgi:hypothetical protein
VHACLTKQALSTSIYACKCMWFMLISQSSEQLHDHVLATVARDDTMNGVAACLKAGAVAVPAAAAPLHPGTGHDTRKSACQHEQGDLSQRSAAKQTHTTRDAICTHSCIQLLAITNGVEPQRPQDRYIKISSPIPRSHDFELLQPQTPNHPLALHQHQQLFV